MSGSFGVCLVTAAPNSQKAFKGFKFNSVGSQFRRQLAELMAQLHVMEPHYIRCIKPNSLNKPLVFEGANVLQQLRCGGGDLHECVLCVCTFESAPAALLRRGVCVHACESAAAALLRRGVCVHACGSAAAALLRRCQCV